MEFVQKMITKSGLPVKVQIKPYEELGTHGGMYVARTKTFYINPFHEIEQYASFLRSMNIANLEGRELAEVLVAHELGHASDDYLSYRNEREEHFYHAALQSAHNGEDNGVKYYYKQCYGYRMQTEMIAWRPLQTFLLSNMEKSKIKQFENYALQTYRNKSHYELEGMLVISKLLPKLKQVSALFPRNVRFQIELYQENKEGYDPSRNTFTLFLEPYLLHRKKKTQQIHIVDSILYDTLYQYVKQSCRYYDMESYQQSLENMVQNMPHLSAGYPFVEKENQNFLWNEKQIFDTLRHFFANKKTFSVFENQKMIQTKEQLEGMKRCIKRTFHTKNTTVK